jgi:hypothetical protein
VGGTEIWTVWTGFVRLIPFPERARDVLNESSEVRDCGCGLRIEICRLRNDLRILIGE